MFPQIFGKVLAPSKIIRKRVDLAIKCAMDSNTGAIQVLNRDGNVSETMGIKQGLSWLNMMSQQATSFDFPEISIGGPRPQFKETSFGLEMPISRKTIIADIFDLKGHICQVVGIVWSHVGPIMTSLTSIGTKENWQHLLSIHAISSLLKSLSSCSFRLLWR